jgi:hypothetical protein
MADSETQRGRRDYWYAFAGTCVFMLIWAFTPLGQTVTGLVGQFRGSLRDWTWPVAGLAFFWLCRLALYLLRKRGKPAGADIR